MPNGLRKITRLFIIKWNENLQYRGDITLWTLAEAITPLVSLAIWYAVASHGHSPISPQETLTYYIAIMFIRSLTNSWGGIFLSQAILNGNIVQYLTRPMSLFWLEIAENITTKSIRLFLPFLLLACILLVFPNLFSPQIFAPSHVLLFLVSLLLGATLAFVIDMSFAMLAFWLENALQIRWYQNTLLEISSGTIIPLYFLPAALQTTFIFLPFRYIISAPAEILLGKTIQQTPSQLIAIQVLWIIIFMIALRLLWRRGLKIYAPPGQ